MALIVAAVDRVAGLLAGIAAVALAAIFLLLLAEIIGRSWFGVTTAVSWEYGSYLMAATVFLGAAHTLRSGGHVRVGLTFELLGPVRARLLDLAASLAGLLVAVAVAYALTQLAWLSHVRGVRSWYPTQTPLALPQAVVALGAWALVVQLLARIGSLLTGRPAEVRAPEGGRPGTEA